MHKITSLCLSFALFQAVVAGSASPALAQEIQTESRSSSTITVEQKKGYDFKYSERLKDWTTEIDKGVTKGWLTNDKAQQFRDRITQLRTLNETVSSHSYAKPELDDMEKQFNQFNIDLSHATENASAGSAATECKPSCDKDKK